MEKKDWFPNLSESQSRNLICCSLLLFLPFLVFWPVASGQSIWSVGDFAGYMVPMNTVAADQWQRGQLPLWNPYLSGGTPLAAAQNPGAFYPLNIFLGLLLPPWTMLGYSILIHLALMGWATYLFLRSLRLHAISALLGALVFQWSGFTMSHLGHANILRALPWIAIALFAFNSWVDTHKTRYLATLSLAAAFLFLSGYPQIIVFSTLLIGTYFAFARRVRPRPVYIASVAFLLGAGISSLQLIPGLALWLSHEYIGPGDGAYFFFASFSFHPAYLVTLLFPRARLGNYAEAVGYVGIVPLILAFLASVTKSENENDRVRTFFIFWAVLSLVLALGRYVRPLAQLTFRIPIYGSFSVVSRHLLEFTFSLAVLAAYGCEGLVNWAQGTRLRMARVKVLALIIGVFSLYAFFSPFRPETARLEWSPSFQVILKPLVFMIASFAFIWMATRINKTISRLSLFSLLLLTVIDLADFGVPIYSPGLSAPDFYKALPSTVLFMQQEPTWADPFRIISFDATGALLDRNLAKEMLAANHNVTYKVESLLAHDGLQLRRFNVAFGGKIPPWGTVDPLSVNDPRFRDLLDLYGVKYLLAEKSQANILSRFYKPVLSTESVSLFENAQARPRLFAAGIPPLSQRPIQHFGDRLSLIQYNLRKIDVGDDSVSLFALTTHWSCHAPLTSEIALHAYYLSPSGQVLSRGDHMLGAQLGNTNFPTTRWHCPGIYQDEHYVPREAVEAGMESIGFDLRELETGSLLPPSGSFPVDSNGNTLLPMPALTYVKTGSKRTFTDEDGREWFAPDIQSEDTYRVHLTSYEGARVKAEVDFNEPGILIHGTNDVPGWRAAMDGVRTPIFRMEGSLQAVHVPPGKHHVEFEYEPSSVKWGAALSVFFLGSSFFLCVWARGRLLAIFS